jgi:hypothetical protein
MQNRIHGKGIPTMTSEICVMNRMSVVLAADSASTITYYENGKPIQRYFKGANKVFQLSERHPVGLMIYGNAELQGVPWELAIKAFRKQLEAKSYDTILGYAQAFEQFLDGNIQLFPEALRDQNFRNSVAIEVAISCRDFNSAIAQDDDFNETASLASIRAAVEQRSFENGLNAENEQQLLDFWPQIVLDHLREDADGFFSEHLGERNDVELLEIVSTAISIKARALPSSPTGLVFAGYGDQSIYPEITIVKSAGFLARKLVMGNCETIAISQQHNSFISGFAQASMTDTFIIGFDAQVYSTINQVQTETLPDVLAPFAEALGGTVERTETGVVLKNAQGQVVIDEDTFSTLVGNSLSSVGNAIMSESRQQHGEPLERVISMLPVEEMAELAATMVDLQSLKEKVTRPSETVGGPVDVAIITKNEGLVWKKRKHFFDADINQRYLHRLHKYD